MRWCTRQLKLKPFESTSEATPSLATSDPRRTRIANRVHFSTKPKHAERLSIQRGRSHQAGRLRILEEAGLGLPHLLPVAHSVRLLLLLFQRKRSGRAPPHHPDSFRKRSRSTKSLITKRASGNMAAWRVARTSLPRQPDLQKSHNREGEKPSGRTLLSVLGDSSDDEDDGGRLLDLPAVAEGGAGW